MNLNEGVLNLGRGRTRRGNAPFMGPPISTRTPKSRSRSCLSSSRTSDLPWGRSHESIVINSPGNKKSVSSKSNTTDTDEDRIIVAITEGRGEARCEVGIAAINVSRPLLVLCQMSDSQSYSNTLTKLNIINPHMIIYPATFESTSNRLISEIRKRFRNKKVVAYQRKAFNKGNGLDKLLKICFTYSFPLLMMMKNRYYALAAASGLLTYLQDILYIYYSTHSIKLEYQASEGYAIIDIATADRLELVCSNQPAEANRYSSLFGIMNRCLTRVGTRHLRTIILQPLYSSQKINERLDCVDELIKKQDILLAIQGVLPKLSSIDQLLSLSTLVPEDAQECTNRQLNYLLLLNGVVDCIEPLNEALKNATQPFFHDFRKTLCNENFDVIKNLIRQTIHEDAYSARGQQADQQRIWAIRPEINGLLDLVRKTFSERIEDMREYIKNLSTKYDLPLTLSNNNKKGYHIIMTLNQNQRKHMKTSDLPEEFIQVFRLANSFTMKTAELVNLSTRIDDILRDLFSLSNLTIYNTIIEIKQYGALFYELVEGVSYLDILQSLAEASQANSWSRPKFAEYTEVSHGHHPLLDFLCQKTPVSNPVASCEHYNFHIITGPNGAGKSIFIRQVMLLQIMAQAGCFVPAQTAIFRPADKMFARISNEDDMESNASSFVLEMNEVNYILTTMTDRSLIIIDELCRSTSVEEGNAIAMQICMTLARSKAFTFVTTHFIMLTKLAELFVNIKVWQLETVPMGDTRDPKALKLDFKFSLVPGVTSITGYGIYMVKDIWPKEVLKHVDKLQASYVENRNNPKFPSIDKRVRLRYDLDCKLNRLKLRKRFTLAQLNKLINEYNSEMQKLGAEAYEYSQNIINQFQEVSNDDLVVLDHSIFDGTQSPLNHLASQEDIEIEHENVSSDSRKRLGMYHLSQTQSQQLEIFSRDISSQSIDNDNIENNNFFNLPPNNEPQIILDYDSSQCDSLNITQNQEIRGEENFHNPDGLSQLSSAALSEQYEETKRQEEMDKLHSQESLTAPRHLQKPEFMDTFSRLLQDDSRKTSTPRIGRIQADAKGFGDSSNLSSISKRFAGDVTHVSTDKLSFIVPRHQEDNIDIASVVEDLESFVEEIENNENDDKGADIDNDSSQRASQLSSGASSQKLEPVMRQEGMDKHLLQSPSALRREGVPQEPVSPFTNTFSRPLQEDSRKTSTPMIRRIQPEGANLPKIISKRYSGDVTHVSTDRMSFSLPRHQEGYIDIASMVEDLESFVEEIENNNEGDKLCSQASPGPPIAPQDESRKSTISPNQSNAKYSKNCSSTLSKRYDGDVAADRMSLGWPYHQEADLDIASMVDLESFVAEIGNNQRENDDEGSVTPNDGLSQQTSDGRNTLGGEEMDKLQAPQVPVSPFTLVLSRATELDSRKTSTQLFGRIQRDAKCFGKSSNLTPSSKRFGENVTHMMTSDSRQQKEDKDIGSKVETFVGLTENEKKEISSKEAEPRAKVKHLDIFPRVHIKRGLGAISEESSKSGSQIDDDDTIVRPILRNSHVPLSPIQPDIESKLIEPEITKEKEQSEKIEPKPYFEEYDKPADATDKAIEPLKTSRNDPNTESLMKENRDDKQEDLALNISLIEDNQAENGELIVQKMEENHQEENNITELEAETHLETNVDEAKPQKEENLEQKQTNETSQDSEENTISYSPLVPREDDSSANLVRQINGESNLETIEDLENCKNEGVDNYHKMEQKIKTEEETNEKIEAREEHDTNQDMERVEVIEVSDDDDDQDIQKNESNIEFDLESHITNPLFPHLSLMVEDQENGPLHQSFSSTEKFFTPNASGYIDYIPKSIPSKKIDIISDIILKPKDTDQEKISNNTKETVSQRIEEVNTSLSTDAKSVNVKRKTPSVFTPVKKIKSSSESSNSKKSTSTLKSSDSKKSISEASKLRNLDGDFSTTSTSSGPKKVETSTSLSSASRKRNLEKSKSSDSVSNKKKTKKFVAPLKKRSTDNIEVAESISSKKSSVPAFTSPSKLTQKAIRDAFFEQDKKFYETSGSSQELAKVWEERLKRPPRPTAKQIQQTTCLATIRKTNEGVQVIPAEKKVPKSSGRFLKSFLSAPNTVNMNIFSDRNAETFDQFISSKNKDYKSYFNINQPPSQQSDDGNWFNFQQVKSAEYTQSIQSWTFKRKRSDELDNASASQKSTSASGNNPFSANSGEFNINEGLFKQNKEFGNLRKFK